MTLKFVKGQSTTVRDLEPDERSPQEHPWKTRAFYGLLGLCALFSGASLVAHILTGIPLTLVLGTAGLVVVFASATIFYLASRSVRRRFALLTWVGLASGLLATGAYDLSKALLSYWDPSPYNPFEAIRVFGTLIIGPDRTPFATLLAGGAFHVLNGLSFAISYTFLFGRAGVLGGMAWGVFLEVFQLTLYPGWLDIRTYNEFAQISFTAHLIYGAVLGWLCRKGIGLRSSVEV